MNQKPYVISISAVSGGGKTTLSKHLSVRLPKSIILSFDEYDFDGPNDICDWVERGADYQEWNLMPLVSDLKYVINNRASEIDFIILDYPFAYLHKELAEYIDFSVFIDTPLDIAMARRLIRDFEDSSSIEKVINELSLYLSRGRMAYLNMLDTVKPNSNFIIDGSLPVNLIAEQICEEIL